MSHTQPINNLSSNGQNGGHVVEVSSTPLPPINNRTSKTNKVASPIINQAKVPTVPIQNATNLTPSTKPPHQDTNTSASTSTQQKPDVSSSGEDIYGSPDSTEESSEIEMPIHSTRPNPSTPTAKAGSLTIGNSVYEITIIKDGKEIQIEEMQLEEIQKIFDNIFKESQTFARCKNFKELEFTYAHQNTLDSNGTTNTNGTLLFSSCEITDENGNKRKISHRDLNNERYRNGTTSTLDDLTKVGKLLGSIRHLHQKDEEKIEPKIKITKPNNNPFATQPTVVTPTNNGANPNPFSAQPAFSNNPFSSGAQNPFTTMTNNAVNPNPFSTLPAAVNNPFSSDTQNPFTTMTNNTVNPNPFNTQPAIINNDANMEIDRTKGVTRHFFTVEGISPDKLYVHVYNDTPDRKPKLEKNGNIWIFEFESPKNDSQHFYYLISRNIDKKDPKAMESRNAFRSSAANMDPIIKFES